MNMENAMWKSCVEKTCEMLCKKAAGPGLVVTISLKKAPATLFLLLKQFNRTDSFCSTWGRGEGGGGRGGGGGVVTRPHAL